MGLKRAKPTPHTSSARFLLFFFFSLYRQPLLFLAVHHYWVSARGGNSGVLPLASLLSQRVTLDFLMIENRKKFFTLLQHLDLSLGLRSSLLVASLLLHPSQRMVLRWRPSYLKRAYL